VVSHVAGAYDRLEAKIGRETSQRQFGLPAQATREKGELKSPVEEFEHTIARGENLGYIAGLYCTTVPEIQELNGIENPNRIQVDQVILIPGGGCE